MREKVSRLEKELDATRQELKGYVTYVHFNAVVEPLRRSLEAVERDIREILHAVSGKTPGP